MHTICAYQPEVGSRKLYCGHERGSPQRTHLLVSFGCRRLRCVFLLLDGVVDAQAQEESHTIVVRDFLDKNTHNLSGMVVVPSPCHELITYTKQIDPANYLLAFETWEDPNRTCAQNEISRAFHLTLFAASTGIAFQGMFNERSIPLQVIRTSK